MDAVGKIYWGGTSRKGLDISIRGKHVNIIREKIYSNCLQKFLRVFKVLLPLQQLAKPGEALAVAFRDTPPFFVHPVCRYTLIGNAMHLLGSDLNLNPLAIWTNYSGMKGLVHIGLGHPYVIFETPRDRFPE